MKSQALTSKFEQSFALRLMFFTLLNFGALAFGALLMGDGPMSEWYINLNKAPWTPPGWVFGVAWFTIMVCFSIYLTLLYTTTIYRSKLMAIYGVQLVVNMAWNPIFFGLHYPVIGLVVLILLTVIVGLLLFQFLNEAKIKTLFILPYFTWLLLATSLNAYIVFQN